MFREPLAVAVDIIIITPENGHIKILLIRRNNDPYKGKWALPGGFVKEKEELIDAAERELKEETGVSGVNLEQLYAFGGVERDPRGRVVSVAFVALQPKETIVRADTDAMDADWFPIYDLPELAFDHDEIVNHALTWLKHKLEHSQVCKYLLPEKFTIDELQLVYEAVLGNHLDEKEFSKEVLNSGKLIEVKSKGKLKLYSFDKKLEKTF